MEYVLLIRDITKFIERCDNDFTSFCTGSYFFQFLRHFGCLLLGSIPSGHYGIGLAFFKINLREHGSGNTGTTNTFRILGKKAGMATFVIDFFKGTIATLLPLIFHVQGISPLIFGLLAVIGHTFPIFCRI